MYSVVLLAAMTAAPEAPGFGDIWAKHCFWESCLPARYGWVHCGPGYQAYYPASYHSCHGCGGYWHGCHGACHGCYGGCRGCHGYWHGCHGAWWGGAIHYSGCSGAYYSCYGTLPTIYTGIGYAGFAGQGNFGNYGMWPGIVAPVFAPAVEVRPADAKPADVIKPVEIMPIPKRVSLPSESKASVVVRVPADAKVYIDDHLMQSKSSERTFTSPAIEAGQAFFYTIRVVVEKDGKTTEDVRKVTVRAGEVSRVDFDNIYDRIRPDDRTIVDSTRNPIR